MEDPIVKEAQLAFSGRIKDSNDVSEHTKNAQAIGRVWRVAVHNRDPDRFQIEAVVAPDLGSVGIQDSHSSLAVIQALDGPIRFD
jgi:hypothetical protein